MIKLIIFILVLSMSLVYISNIVSRKVSYLRKYDFFSQKEDFDILFLGSSHMINAVFPMQLWKDYGIVSYNISNHGERQTGAYYNILMALNYTKPKLIVIDGFYISENEKYTKETEAQIHDLLDVYPISYTKYQAVKDIYSEENVLEREIEYLFPFSMYHSRWNNLNASDFKKEVSFFEKGAEMLSTVEKQEQIEQFDLIEEYSGEETVNMKYLRKIIEYCKANDIQVLVTYIPYMAKKQEISASKYIKKICDEYNVNYINFLEKNIVDNDINYGNEGHLNTSGGKKITDYLGKYIMENYEIEDKRENQNYTYWNTDYFEYAVFKKWVFTQYAIGKNLNSCLMLLYNEEDFDYKVTISSKKNISNDIVLKKLLDNLDNNYEINDEVFKDHKDKTVKIVLYELGTNNELQTEWF